MPWSDCTSIPTRSSTWHGISSLRRAANMRLPPSTRSSSPTEVQTLGRGFAWLDTGTHDSLAEASNYIETIEKRQGLQIACLEGIAYTRGWIDEGRLRELAAPMLKNDYGQYLLKVIDYFKESGKVDFD